MDDRASQGLVAGGVSVDDISALLTAMLHEGILEVVTERNLKMEMPLAPVRPRRAAVVRAG